MSPFLANREQLEADLTKLLERYSLPFAVIITRLPEIENRDDGKTHLKLMHFGVMPQTGLVGDVAMTRALQHFLTERKDEIMALACEIAGDLVDEMGLDE